MSLFEPTIPFGEPELMRVSTFRRYLAESYRHAPDAGASSTWLASLGPSLRADLRRFEQGGRGADVLEVLAACVRHTRALTVHLACDDKAVPLTVFPRERLAHCPLDLQLVVEARGLDLPVLEVERAVLRPLGGAGVDEALVGEPHLYRPLAPLLWTLALRGARGELLPEVAGTAVYRVARTFDLTLAPAGLLRDTLLRLTRQVASLREIAEWPGFDRDRAVRLINALYLQSGLIISRSHPAALGESWFGGASGLRS